MTLSVLTIVKDRSTHLAQLIEGLRRSTHWPDELIIVDMASTPPINAEQAPFPIQILRLDGPGLPLAACLTDHDALICADIRYLGPDDARGKWEEADLLPRAQGHPVREFPTNGVRREDNAGLFWSLAFGLHRQRFFDLGGFDEAFTGYGGEDTDFGFRARAAGLPLLFMGGAGAFHQYHDVFDPPLQYLNDIVRNASLFRARWNIWPMEGWLNAFEGAGFIVRCGDMIHLLRQPSDLEIRRARMSPPVAP
jgi:hypothetical protein